jgi:flagellar biosynthesis chaperone FliJ
VLEQRDVDKQAKVANKKEQRMMDEFAMRATRNAK